MLTPQGLVQTKRSRLDLFNSSVLGFKTKFSSIKATRTAETGPLKGISEMAKAAEAAVKAGIMTSLFLSLLKTVTII